MPMSLECCNSRSTSASSNEGSGVPRPSTITSRARMVARDARTRARCTRRRTNTMRRGSSSSSMNSVLVITCDLAGNSERPRRCPRRDHDVRGRELSPGDRDPIIRDESRLAVQRLDSRLLESRLSIRGHGIREAPLESHQRRPVDRGVARHPVTAHTSVPRHDFRCAHEHLFRIAAAIAAGAAKRLIVDYGHSPPGGATVVRGRGTARPRAEHEQIKFVRHCPLA